MTAEPDRLAVVVVNWNQAEETIECVRSLDSEQVSSAAVWVVDNGSATEDRTRIAATCPRVRLIASQENLGFGGANNRAIERALAEGCGAILLLNNDARIDCENLLRLRHSFHSDPRLAVLGPLIWDAERPSRLLSAGGRDIGLFAATHLRERPEPGLSDMFYVPGTCALLRSAALREIGLFDERYFFSGEMADLCVRARQQGWRCAIDSSSRATHRSHTASTRRRQLHAYYEFRNRYLFVRKFHHRRRHTLFLIWTWRCGLAAAESFVRNGRSSARAIALAAFDGLVGRFGGQNARVSEGRFA